MGYSPWDYKRVRHDLATKQVKVQVTQSCLTLCDPFPWLYSPWNSAAQNTGMGNLSLLQGIFPIQGWNQGLPHCRQILYQLSYKENPRILEWVAYPFSSRSSWLRNWTRVSCIAGGFFTNWAIREDPTTAIFQLLKMIGSYLSITCTSLEFAIAWAYKVTSQSHSSDRRAARG